jgi:benzoyl-CoA reductase subunit B
MGSSATHDREKFEEVFEELFTALQNMGEAMEMVGDPRETCSIEVIKGLSTYFKDIFSAVADGKKILWHGGLTSPELFYGFENVQPYALEIPIGMLAFLDPDGANQYVDLAEDIGMPSDICALDKALLGSAIARIHPPGDVVIIPTAPCDSILSGHQILEKLMDVPVIYWDMPYAKDDRAIDFYAKHVWSGIQKIEERLNTRMDWDKCREHIRLGNELTELLLTENEMRKLSPCPHCGKLGTTTTMLNYIACGTSYARDIARKIVEDSKRLAAEKKGALENERLRMLWYYPDPLYDLAVHDWLEDEYSAITVLTMFGHATFTFIDPSTPESIVRSYAWKMMNACMARQLRGPYEYFMDDFLRCAEDYRADAAVFPIVLPCKHSQAMHGFVREACREIGLPLLTPNYEPVDSRPVSIENLHAQLAEFMENQLLPNL